MRLVADVDGSRSGAAVARPHTQLCPIRAGRPQPQRELRQRGVLPMNQTDDPVTDCATHCPLAGVPNCHETCPAHTPHVLPPLDFDEAMACFRREAQHGVCNTGRYRLPYFTWGTGAPLLFIPGVSDVADSFIGPIS